MKKYKTKVGEIEIDENEIIEFEQGLPGFEDLKKFVVISLEDTYPIKWLVSIEREDIAFPIVEPNLVRYDYMVEIPKDIVEYLQLKEPNDAYLYAIMTIPPGDPENITINLKAPIIISKVNKKGIQYIIDSDQYDLRHKVKDEIERSKKLMQESQESRGEKDAGSGKKD